MLANIMEGYRSTKHLWTIGIFSIALLVNPIQPLTSSREMFLWLGLLSLATLLTSLVLLRAKPILSISSIPSRTASG